MANHGLRYHARNQLDTSVPATGKAWVRTIHGGGVARSQIGDFWFRLVCVGSDLVQLVFVVWGEGNQSEPNFEREQTNLNQKSRKLRPNQA